MLNKQNTDVYHDQTISSQKYEPFSGINCVNLNFLSQLMPELLVRPVECPIYEQPVLSHPVLILSYQRVELHSKHLNFLQSLCIPATLFRV